MAEVHQPPASIPDPGPVPALAGRPHLGFDMEHDAYMAAKPELLSRAEGKFVVFVRDAMIGPFDDFRTAFRSGIRQFGWGPLYIKHVQVEEPSATSGTVEVSCRS